MNKISAAHCSFIFFFQILSHTPVSGLIFVQCCSFLLDLLFNNTVVVLVS
jgi:hypothetical protein